MPRPSGPKVRQFVEETGLQPGTKHHYTSREPVVFSLWISPEAILYAKPKNPSCCVIANAIKQRFGLSGQVYPMIDVNTTRWDSDGKRYVMRTPIAASNLLRLYDDPTTRDQIKPCRIWYRGFAWVMSEEHRKARAVKDVQRKRDRKAGAPAGVYAGKLRYATAVRYEGMSVPGNDQG